MKVVELEWYLWLVWNGKCELGLDGMVNHYQNKEVMVTLCSNYHKSKG